MSDIIKTVDLEVHPTITIAVAIWKGGSGKTTTSINLAAGLAMKGKRVLIIDDDSQRNATKTLLSPDVDLDTANSTYSLYFGGSLADAVYPSVINGLDIVPSKKSLSIVELELIKQELQIKDESERRKFEINRKQLLRKALRCDFARKYDYIIIDTPPALGTLVVNALTAADKLLIPIKGFFALEGLNDFLDIFNEVKNGLNPQLEIDSILLTMYNDRIIINQDIKRAILDYFGDNKLLNTTIPQNVKVEEACSYKEPIFTYDPSCTGARAYMQLTEELLARWEA